MDKALEKRLREALNDPMFSTKISISRVDAKRLLYRLKKENSERHEPTHRSKDRG